MLNCNIIEVANLRKAYKSVSAIDDISFQVQDGEIFGLLGPNGAGKTTTVECLQGLRHRDSGTIRVLGLDPQADASSLKKQIGSQLQESALPDRIKVWEALDLFASHSIGAVDWSTLIEQWGLKEKRDAAFGVLSGGQRQRLLIALALVNNPKVVFLDEMTTGLDPAARRVTWDLIRAIRDRGTTVILVTHFMDEAENLCDRIGIMNNGKLAALDTPQNLINIHANLIKVIFSTERTDIDWLKSVPHVHNLSRHGQRIEVEGDGPVLALVASELVKHGIVPVDLRKEQPSLEDVFLKITGRSVVE
ncbi:MAG: ABC transporter ATP-binding protein [Dehalococcoidales bacterium]